MAMAALGWLAAAGALLASVATAYEVDAKLPVQVSSVEPYDNPTAKWQYDFLPWPCKPEHPHQRTELGDIVTGERLRDAMYNIHFRRASTKQSLCGEKELSGKDVQAFKAAIDQRMQYEMHVDGLPIWGQVGLKQADEVTGEDRYFLITHRHFHVRYNGDDVIMCNISTELAPGQFVEVTSGAAVKLSFTYSVAWSPTTVQYADRYAAHMHAYPTKYQVEAHWLWVLNSSLLVVLLTGLLSMILLRTLKNDVARYLEVDKIDAEDKADGRMVGEEEDDSGWKRVRFFVFQPPAQPYWFSAIVGVGAQILMIALSLLLLAVIGWFYPGNHGRIYVAAIFLYSFTSYVAGYVGSAKLKEVSPDNHDWMLSCASTSFLFAGPFLVNFAIVNTVAISYESSIALPFATIVAIVLLWAFVTLPLTAFGAYRGGKVVWEEYPCHTKKIAPPAPKDLSWYHQPWLLALTAGFLPFMAIYVEVHTIFMSVWGHQAYTLFGILLLTFFILLIVTSFVVILMTYFQLTAEDHRWWWASIIRGSACGIFMYAYAIYYWCYTSHMSGILQGSVYFGYTLMVSYAFSLMLATVGHWSSRWFVIRIYRAIKSD